ncbi:hypothetical protein AB395_00006310 (plasmid) [Sinorhizobium fredii CCBAU 45436]|nr:hypothetical protein AB395_00006310 [Sinorhizobium fredii CCBAU 45436]
MVVVLGLASAALEGAGIGLIIPMLGIIAGSDDSTGLSGISAVFQQVGSGLGKGERLLALAAAVLAWQRQRIALARALVRDPAILILDEVTNAVDGLSEAAVVETLKLRARRRTTIVISHHRSTNLILRRRRGSWRRARQKQCVARRRRGAQHGPALRA